MTASLQTKPATTVDGQVEACTVPKAGSTETKRVRSLYGVMQSIEGRLGGGEGVEGLYGSIKMGGMQRVLAAMEADCSLNADSCLVDVGAGLGRPLMHAMIAWGIELAFGVEIDAIKCQKAEAFLRQTQAALRKRGVVDKKLAIPPITCAAIEQVTTLIPATHAYSFWEGVPTEGRMAFGRLFAKSPTLQAVAVVQRAVRGEKPAEMMSQLGFGALCLTDSFPVSMSGSGRSFRAYVFRRDGPVQCSTAAPSLVSEHPQQPARMPTETRALQQAVLQNLQLGRVLNAKKLIGMAPPLSAKEVSARIASDARSARRATRSSKVEVYTQSELQLTKAKPRKARLAVSVVAKESAPGLHQEAIAEVSSHSTSARSKPVPAAVLTHATATVALQEAPATVEAEVLTAKHDLPTHGIDSSNNSPIQSVGSPVKQAGSPIKSKGSPLKSKGSPLKITAGGHRGAQREIWGRARKHAVKLTSAQA